MLTYSCLRLSEAETARDYARKRLFIGFYVPLHLEFLASLPGQNVPDDQRVHFFQFAFNCAAARSLLSQVLHVLGDVFSDPRERLLAEGAIIDGLCARWFPDSPENLSTIRDLQARIDLLYETLDYSSLRTTKAARIFAKPLLSPIRSVLAALADALRLDTDRTNWLVCIDEAEFLPEPFIKCINTFMRDEKRPLIIKMATLPFKHSTRETLLGGVMIESGGRDFNYRVLDMQWDSSDFQRLTDHLCRVRLRKCGLEEERVTLETFLGVEGVDDDLIDYYRGEMGEDEATEEAVLDGICAALSPVRRANLEKVAGDREKCERPYFHRFSPVYFVRRMKAEDKRGNRTVGWFAGARVVRRISDGNPRRFIQAMNALLEKARDSELTPKNQHRVLVDFCGKCHAASEGLPEHGPVLKAILDRVGGLLESRVHGEHMVDGGCAFRLSASLADDDLFAAALQLAVAYCLVWSDEESLLSGLAVSSRLRLSFLYGVCFWLPMRRGDPPVLNARQGFLPGFPRWNTRFVDNMGAVDPMNKGFS